MICANQAHAVLGIKQPEGSFTILQKESDTFSYFLSIKQLLKECRELHRERIKKLEVDLSVTKEDLLQMKLKFFQSFVNDLTDQNHLLVEIIEDSWRESGCNLEFNVDVRTQLKGDPHSSDSLVHVLMDLEDLNYCHESNTMDVCDVVKEFDQPAQENQKVLVSGEILSCLQQIHEDNVKEIAEKDVLITKLQAELKTSECKLNDKSQTLGQTRTSLETERQQKEKIQEQLQTASDEVEKLQRELTRVQKKIQRRESKLSVLLKELMSCKALNADYKDEILVKEKALLNQRQEIDDLRAVMEVQVRECVHLNQTKERLEADLALSHEQIHNSHLEVRSRDQFILQLRAEMTTAEQKHLDAQEKVQMFKEKLEKQEIEIKVLRQQLKGAENERDETRLQTAEQKETAALFKQKYTAAVEKIQRVHEQVEVLQEELRFSQDQLKKSQSTARSTKAELTELERRYQEKADQWERSQEVLDQLTDDLQTNQQLLRDSEEKVEHFRNLMGSLQEQLDTFKQQRQMLEHDLQLYKQSHTYSNEEYLSLLTLWQQLKKNCTDQAERLVECEKVTSKMKSELHRQTQENKEFSQCASALHRAQLSHSTQLEQEVASLKTAVTSLKTELAERQKVEMTLLRQSEEKVKEAREEAARRRREEDSHRGEVQRLQGELQNREENVKIAIGEIQGLSAHVEQLSLELEDQRRKHHVAMEEVADRSEEVQRMERCLEEGELAEERIRLMAVTLEEEVTELRRDLSLAVDHKLQAEREKQDAQLRVIAVTSQLEETRSDNAKLQHESSMVVENVNLWIEEQKASKDILTSQIQAQNKELIINTAEKQHLQEANDTLKAEVKTLKAALDEKERQMQRFKAQIQDCGVWKDNKNAEMKSRVTQKLSKIEDMQSKLHSNLRAIRKLNQQLEFLSRENKRLRRQPERTQPPPPVSVSARPRLPVPTSLPSSFSLDSLTGYADGCGSQTQLSTGVVLGPVETTCRT